MGSDCLCGAVAKHLVMGLGPLWEEELYVEQRRARSSWNQQVMDAVPPLPPNLTQTSLLANSKLEPCKEEILGNTVN